MYGMAIDDRRLEGDHEFEDRGVRIVVDKMSWPLLEGSEVDFVENIMGGGFSVNNPNATSACGCGSSFRTDGHQAPDGEGSASLQDLTKPKNQINLWGTRRRVPLRCGPKHPDRWGRLFAVLSCQPSFWYRSTGLRAAVTSSNLLTGVL